MSFEMTLQLMQKLHQTTPQIGALRMTFTLEEVAIMT